jgi:hypothetical protein
LLYSFFKQNNLPEHHALHDTQANRLAYRPRPVPPTDDDNAVQRILKLF